MTVTSSPAIGATSATGKITLTWPGSANRPLTALDIPGVGYGAPCAHPHESRSSSQVLCW
jgi:hypothetical protein